MSTETTEVLIVLPPVGRGPDHSQDEFLVLNQGKREDGVVLNEYGGVREPGDQPIVEIRDFSASRTADDLARWRALKLHGRFGVTGQEVAEVNVFSTDDALPDLGRQLETHRNSDGGELTCGQRRRQ